MKKLTKVLVVSAMFTLLFALPVMAKEVSISSTNTDVLLQKLQANATMMYKGYAEFAKTQVGPGAEASIAAQAALVTAQTAAVNKECAENHLEYLNKKLNLAKEYEGYRKAQLDWFTKLSQGTNAYARELAVAQAEYAAAVQITAQDAAALAYAQGALANLL